MFFGGAVVHCSFVAAVRIFRDLILPEGSCRLHHRIKSLISLFICFLVVMHAR